MYNYFLNDINDYDKQYVQRLSEVFTDSKSINESS